MTNEELKTFMLKISQANKSGLVILSYEIMINYIESAAEELYNKKYEEFHFNLKKARHFLMDLSSNLDLKYPISSELMSIYIFINKWIIAADSRKDMKDYKRIIKIIDDLRESFIKISETDTSKPELNQSMEVHAGITYGPNSKLKEYTIRK